MPFSYFSTRAVSDILELNELLDIDELKLSKGSKRLLSYKVHTCVCLCGISVNHHNPTIKKRKFWTAHKLTIVTVSAFLKDGIAVFLYISLH